MFFTNKRLAKLNPLTGILSKGLVLPRTLVIDSVNSVKIVKSFELLGITLDSKLTFNLHANKIKKQVNKRIFSFKKLFYLPFSVKLQFFKTFILPIFDYCSSLFIYYSPETLQSIHNSYYISIFLLLKTDIRNLNLIELNLYLNNINLPSLLHRYLTRLLLLAKKIYVFKTPVNLFNQFLLNSSINNSYNFRNRFVTNNTLINNNSGKRTFRYFVGTLINKFCFNEFFLSYEMFSSYLDLYLVDILKVLIINNNKLFNLNLIKINNFISYKLDLEINN